MNCPQCSAEMPSGYAWINASSPSTVEWATEKPSLSRWKLRWGDFTHWKVNLYNEMHANVKPAHQCQACSLLVVQDTGIAARAE